MKRFKKVKNFPHPDPRVLPMKIRSGKDQAWYAIHPLHEKGKSPAYLVAIKRQGLTVSRLFTASVHDSEQAALQAARQWRDRVLALLPPMTYRQMRTLVRRNNTSGIPGVTRVQKASGIYWIASGTADGKDKIKKSFNVNTYGEEGAKQKALDARRQMLQAVDGKFWVATAASLDFTTQTFDDPQTLVGNDALVWDDRTQEQFLARPRAEGLIGKPRTPPVRKCEYASLPAPVWEATHIAADGKRIIRRFSVAKYGDKAAECLAQEAYARLKEKFPGGRQSEHGIR